MPRQSVLVVEDEPDVVDVLKYHLERDGYRVLAAMDGSTGCKIARAEKPDAILLDLMLPQLDGIEVIRILRSEPETRGISILIMSAKGEESDVVLGLGMGADDYIVKPFRTKEVLARLKAVMRRSLADGELPSGTITREPLTIDPVKFEALLEGKELLLTLTEFKILSTLAASPGRVFSRKRLLEEIQGNTYVDERNVDVHITSLRKKLGRHKDLILTVRGVGYKLRDTQAS